MDNQAFDQSNQVAYPNSNGAFQNPVSRSLDILNRVLKLRTTDPDFDAKVQELENKVKSR